MIREARQQNATIIPFPNASQRQAKRFEQEARRITEGAYEVVTDGWYHAEAIHDADQTTKQ